MRLFLALGLAAGLASPAEAEDTLQRPDSCVLVATAQFDNCTVQNIYVCAGPEGAFWREEDFSDLGLDTVTNEWRATGRMEMMAADGSGGIVVTYSGDLPADVLRKGSGSQVASGDMEMFGMRREISSDERLTLLEGSVEQAGTVFHRIESVGTIQMPYPVPSMSGRDVSLYNEELDLLITESSSLTDNVEPIGYALARLSLPVQAGFGAEVPTHGCLSISSLSTPRPEVPA